MNHKRRSKARRWRVFRVKLAPWYCPLVMKGLPVKRRRERHSEREQRAEQEVA